MVMVHFYQLILTIDNVGLKLYTSLSQKQKCTLFAGSTVVCPYTAVDLVSFPGLETRLLFTMLMCHDTSNETVMSITVHTQLSPHSKSTKHCNGSMLCSIA